MAKLSVHATKLPVISELVAERVINSPDYDDESNWNNFPPEASALACAGLIRADQLRKAAAVGTIDIGDAYLRGMSEAIIAVVEQLGSDAFVNEISQRVDELPV